MKVLFVNTVCGVTSTGKISAELAEGYIREGHEAIVAYGKWNVPEKYRSLAHLMNNKVDVLWHSAMTRAFDLHGRCSKKATEEFVKWAQEYDPDVLWLHNLHGYYINYEVLFDWIKSRPEMEVKWTLHDCWTFTGHCAYFTAARCDQWKTGCRHCVQKTAYPSSYGLSLSASNYEKKKKAFTGVKKMTIITPSKWLADLVKESFLKEYPVEVVHNHIDLNVFKPTESDFREKNGLTDKKIVLGVASIWDARKGLDDFVALIDKLPKEYQIVVVGVTKKQKEKLPEEILAITRTNNVQELAAIYTAADVFVNTTYEDNYPTVNLEAQACGTPVITYATGGSVESVLEENIVEVGNLEALSKRIQEVGQGK